MYHSKQYRFFRRNPSVQSPCNPRRTLLQYNHHATPGEPCFSTITMQPQENPASVQSPCNHRRTLLQYNHHATPGEPCFSTITMQPQENPASVQSPCNPRRTLLQYNHHATPGEPCFCRVLLGLHGNCTEGFFLKNLYCLEVGII